MLSLALGVGANSAIFQLVDAVRLRTLPVANPQELVTIDFAKNSSRSGNWFTRSARFTSVLWEQLRGLTEPFTGTIAWSAARFNVAPAGEARNVEGQYVSGDFFRVLGVQPWIGRIFTAADDRRGCGMPGAVVSYAFWQRELGGDRGRAGTRTFTGWPAIPVIGVTPPQFFGVEVGTASMWRCRYVPTWTTARDRAPTGGSPPWAVSSRAGRTDAPQLLQDGSPAIIEATLPPTYRPDQVKRYLANKLVADGSANGCRDCASSTRPALPAAGGHRPGAADRLRQSGQPAAGARHRPRT